MSQILMQAIRKNRGQMMVPRRICHGWRRRQGRCCQRLSRFSPTPFRRHQTLSMPSNCFSSCLATKTSKKVFAPEGAKHVHTLTHDTSSAPPLLLLLGSAFLKKWGERSCRLSFKALKPPLQCPPRPRPPPRPLWAEVGRPWKKETNKKQTRQFLTQAKRHFKGAWEQKEKELPLSRLRPRLLPPPHARRLLRAVLVEK